MQRIAVTTITQAECDEYAFLFEKLLAYRSLRIILRSNDSIKTLVCLPNNVFDIISQEEREINRQINRWWDLIDEKYILIYDDRMVLALDFDDCIIYSIDKEEWYKENPIE